MSERGDRERERKGEKERERGEFLCERESERCKDKDRE